MIFLDSIFKVLWKDDAQTLPGSLSQLRNCVERDVKDSKKRDNKHWNEEDRFFNTVVSCFLTTHAMGFFEMDTIDSLPTKHVPKAIEWRRMNQTAKKEWFDECMLQFVDTFFILDDSSFWSQEIEEIVTVTKYRCGAKFGGHECKNKPFASPTAKPIGTHRESKCCYAGCIEGVPIPAGTSFPVQVRTKKMTIKPRFSEMPAAQRVKLATLNLGLAYEGMRDCIAEGDADRQEVYYGIFHVLCFRTGHWMYNVEMIDRKVNLTALLSARLAFCAKHNKYGLAVVADDVFLMLVCCHCTHQVCKYIWWTRQLYFARHAA